MRLRITKTALFCIAATVPVIAAAEETPSAASSYWALESRYPHDIRLTKAQNAQQMERARVTLSARIPIGTPIEIAERSLQAGGATCRMNRHASGMVRCLYHQYDLSDGAADDIRWTVILQAPAGNVTDLTVDRYVDRHGTS